MSITDFKVGDLFLFRLYGYPETYNLYHVVEISTEIVFTHNKSEEKRFYTKIPFGKTDFVNPKRFRFLTPLESVFYEVS